MLTREQQISLSDISSNSFQWIQSSSIVDWLRSPEPFFWIAGKPGSGKSTLTKHLVQSRWTLDTLKQASLVPWKIVYFYFDYRAGKAIANHPLGMIRRFVRQLCNDLELGNKFKLNKLIRENATMEGYIAFLSEAVRNMSIHICAFVDGLDEYEGDLWELCEILDRLQNQTGMKMCLASRPEDALRNFLGMYPSISMQEHNGPSIATYVERKIHRKAAMVPSIYDLFSATLQQAILDRAEGIILWAKLVVDEMINGCDETTTTGNLLTFLETLPRELESLYDRILGKLNNRFKGEAALIIHMLTEAGGSKDKSLLYAAWSFVQVNILGFPAPSWPLNHRAFDTRLNVLLGNMINTTTLTIGGGGRYQILVQLLHKSLSSYLSKNDWIAHNLPAQVPAHYSSDFFWQRLHTDVLSRALHQNALQADALEGLVTNVFSHRQLKSTHVFAQDEQPFRQHSLGNDLEQIISPRWKIWQDLLTTSVTTYPNFVELSGIRDDLQGPDTVDLCSELELAAGSSRVLLLHCLFCRICAEFIYTPWHISRAKRLYENDALHIMIDIIHRHYTWLMNPHFNRVENLALRVCEDIFDIILLSPRLLTSKDKDMLALLSRRGIQLQGRHLCAIGLSKRVPEIYAAYDQALSNGSNVPLMLSHDSHCSLDGTDVPLAEHWNEVYPSSVWHQIFQRCNIRINDPPPSGSPNLTLENAELNARLSHRQSGRVYSPHELQREFDRAPQHTWVTHSPGPAATLALFESVDEGPDVIVRNDIQLPASSMQVVAASLQTGKTPGIPISNIKPVKASVPRKFAKRLRSLMSID